METAFDFPNRIRNWQRTHRWFRSQGRAFSLEGNYRAKRGTEVDWVLDENGRPLWIGQGSPSVEGPINVLDAWEVELAWRQCTERSRWCLKYHYHPTVDGKLITPQEACRLIKRFGNLILRVNEWRAYMRDARLELRLTLDLMQSGYKRAA